jgi:hypothetical protein
MFGVGWLLHRSSRAKAARGEAAAHGIDAPALQIADAKRD